MSVIAHRFASRPVAWFLLGAAAFLYLHLFFPPWTPIWRGYDEAGYLLNGRRLLEGEVLYRDIFQFVPPGINLLNLLLLKLFGSRVWILNAMVVLIGVSFAWLGIAISSKVLEGRAVFLPSLLFLVSAFRFALEATHHAYSVLAVMAATAVVIEKRNPARVAVAGALCGLASCFTQTHGLMALWALAVFLLWEYRQERASGQQALKSAVCLFAPFLAVGLAVSAYFVWKAGLQRFLYCTVTFGFRYHSGDPYEKWTSYFAGVQDFLTWSGMPRFGLWLFLHGLIPWLYVLFFLHYRRHAGDRPGEPWDRLMLLNLVGFFLFLGIARSPAWHRLCLVSLPAMVLFCWLIYRSGKFQHTLAGIVWILAVVMAVAEPLERQTRWRAYLDLPTGRAAVLEQVRRERYQWFLDRTRPSDFLFQAGDWDMYIPLALRNPTEVLHLTSNEFTRPEQVHHVVEALERRRVRYILWTPDLDFPFDYVPAHDSLGPLRAYMRDHYRLVETFADLQQVWERKK